MQLPVMPPVAPMLSKAVARIPEGPFVYEPKWDGFRSIVFRDGDDVEIGSRNERPMTRYFPEIVAAVTANLPEKCVIDGEIIVVVGDRLEFEVLQQRIHPAASRVRLLSEETPASFIAFDLLALDDTDYTQHPFAERRAALEEAVAGADPPIHLTPATRDHDLAVQWFSQFEGAGLDGVVAKPISGTYQPDKRTMFKIKHERTADCVVAGYRVHKSGPDSIGSLLLGLYKDSGELASVGVIGAFPAARRKELFAELQPLVTTSMIIPGHGQSRKKAPVRHAVPSSAGGTPRKTSPSSRCDPSLWSRSVTNTWKATGSGIPPSSSAGDPTAIRGPARTSSWRSRSGTTSPTSSPQEGEVHGFDNNTRAQLERHLYLLGAADLPAASDR